MTRSGNKKKHIKSLIAVFISLCTVLSTLQFAHAATVKLSELPAGTVITIGGHAWNVLDPVKGYLQSYRHVGEPTKFDPDNTNTYNPLDTNNIGYYLNNTFYNSLTAEGKAMILDHSWSTGNQLKENASSVTCKVGIIGRTEFDTYESYMSHAVTAYFWSRTSYSGTPISIYVVNPDMTDNEKKAATDLSYMVPTVYISPETVITDTMRNHTVTASMNNTSWGSVSFNGKFEIGQTVQETFAEGASVTVTAAPLPGFKVASWTVNGSPVSSTSNTYTFTNGRTDTSVAANFGPITYQVTANTHTNGSVSGSGQYTNGQNVTIRAIPSPGYRFKDWFYEDSSGSMGYRNWPSTYSFQVEAKNYTFTANFETDPNAKNVYLSCDPAEGGTVSGGGIKTAGSSIKLTAAPSEGYRFTGWEQSGSTVSTSAAYTFKVPSSDVSLTAKFELISFKLTTSNPTAGERNKAYSYSFTVAGGMGAKTYTVTGELPKGLTLSADGKLTGTPTEIGSSTFTVSVTESGALARSDSYEYTMTINEEALAISKSNPASETVGSTYSHSFTATGGTGAKSFAVTAGALPAGLTLAADGTLSGTPSAIGTSNFTVTVSDSATPVVTDSNAYSITIAPEPLVVNKANPASVVVGTPYSHSFTATGGTGEKTFAVTTGTLPEGLALAPDGKLSGTPTKIQTCTFTVTVTDSAAPVVSASNEYTLAINMPLAIDTNNPASGTVGTPYTHSFTATGGTGTRSFAVTSGALPAGLSLAADGTLSGTPSAIETSTFTVTVKDSATPEVKVSNSFTMTINPAPLVISKINPAGGTVGTAYTHSFTATGGTDAKSFAVTSGTLPEGLLLADNGTLSGTPTTIGTSNFTVTVSDRATPAVTDSSTYSITIAPEPLVISKANPVSVVVGTPYTHSFTATGGTGAKSFAVTLGTLPEGLLLADNGTLSGTPTTIGTSNFTVTVSDRATPAVTDSSSYTIIINDKAPNNGGGAPSSGSSSTTPSKPANGSTATTTATAKTGTDGKAAASVTQSQLSDALDKAKAAAGTNGKPDVKIEIDGASGASSVGTTIPQASVQALVSGNLGALTISGPTGAVTFDAAALKTISGASSGDVTVTTSKVDTSTLPDTAKQAVGSHPVYEFSVTSGGKTISQFGGSVTVSVPYTPAAGEDANAIVIYYIAADGKLTMVPDARYDAATGTVVFTTAHFSTYAVGYNKMTFTDVSETSWYSNAVTFLAARGITSGTTATSFSPDASLTRGQFITMLLRAYSISPDVSPTNNFADAGNTYYTNYLAAAKRMGITIGIGDNMFAPDRGITRQEMFALLYSALRATGNLPQGKSGKTTADFSDATEIASWAKDAMTLLVETGTVSGSSGKLSPTSATTRAEMAQVLYSLLGK